MRNAGIERLRLLAIVIITAQHAATVTGHYAATFIGDLSWGQFGVAIFAAIAGTFAVADDTAAGPWLWARLVRLYPTYWVAMLLSFAAAAAIGRPFTVYQLVSQFAGTGYFSHGWDLVNVVTWYISLLLLCYGLAALARASAWPLIALSGFAVIAATLMLTHAEIALSRHVLTFCLAAIAGRRGRRFLPIAGAVLLGLTLILSSFAYAACGLMLLWGFSRFPRGRPAIQRVSAEIYEYYLLHGLCLAGAVKWIGPSSLAVAAGVGAAIIGSPLLRATTACLRRVCLRLIEASAGTHPVVEPASSYRASVGRCPPAAELATLWRGLEVRSDASVFLSWAWIGAMMANLSGEALLVRIACGDRLVGLAILGIAPPTASGRSLWRRGMRWPALTLNETGDPARDQVMIEYNGILAESGAESAAAHALFAALRVQSAVAWRSIRLSGVPVDWQTICRREGLSWRLLRHPQSAPYADLPAGADDDPQNAYSRNTKAQIRRSIRYFEQQGRLTLTRAADTAEALQWFAALEGLHTAAWQAKGQAGAFATDCFGDFHRQLIGASFGDGIPDLLCLRAGTSVLGYLYNLRWREAVNAYQSGFHFDGDPRCRPGLVAHMMAIRHYRGEGISRYRFLAGDARYKSSLATGRDALVWMVAFRPSLSRRVDSVIRGLWQRLRKPYDDPVGTPP